LSGLFRVQFKLNGIFHVHLLVLDNAAQSAESFCFSEGDVFFLHFLCWSIQCFGAFGKLKLGTGGRVVCPYDVRLLRKFPQEMNRVKPG